MIKCAILVLAGFLVWKTWHKPRPVAPPPAVAEWNDIRLGTLSSNRQVAERLYPGDTAKQRRVMFLWDSVAQETRTNLTPRTTP